MQRHGINVHCSAPEERGPGYTPDYADAFTDSLLVHGGFINKPFLGTPMTSWKAPHVHEGPSV